MTTSKQCYEAVDLSTFALIWAGCIIFKGQGHQGIFTSERAPLGENYKFQLEYFQGHQGNDQG